jgi:hypothetical protein
MFTDTTRNLTRKGSSLSSLARLSGDGSTVVYSSFSDNFIENDFNRRSDLFMTALQIPSFTDEDRDGLDDAWTSSFVSSAPPAGWAMAAGGPHAIVAACG